MDNLKYVLTIHSSNQGFIKKTDEMSIQFQ